MNHLPALPILIPLFAASIALFFEHRRFGMVPQRIVAWASIAAMLAVACVLVASAGSGEVSVYLLGDWPARLGIVLMVIGYRSAGFVPVYDPMPGMGHANNTLMLISVFLFGVGGTKGTLYTRMRHPMLTGQILWSVAHLLVNGDLASIVLFGGIGLMLLFTLAQGLYISKHLPDEEPASKEKA